MGAEAGVARIDFYRRYSVADGFNDRFGNIREDTGGSDGEYQVKTFFQSFHLLCHGGFW